ncbi:TonB-dependent siderophore receptor [Noviherbaspirillum sp. UKPF54]|uniref:TonB-dependent receptor n=1 Tax=Noviherbaspirillum sp. UKPF54 TaxID=2601898 RepID=UPI001AF021A3|nr:TonB-dependent siderophore receptor [Noviherbaspirillum sp. UKPF54]
MTQMAHRRVLRPTAAFVPRLRPLTALMLAALAQLAQPGLAYGAEDSSLPDITVRAQTERADGPVQGYRATRSSTVTKTDTPLRDVPQSVQVVPESLVKDQGMTSMAQVLRYVPGASMNPGEGGRDQPVLRGISSTSDLYVDGVRDDALYFRDPYNTERFEILKGSSGMTFGRGGAGGIVNRVTKKPLDTPARRAELTVGSYDTKRATADLSGRLSDSVAYRLNAVVEDSGGFREGYQLKRHGINPVVELFPSDDTSVLLSYEHFDDKRTVDRGIPSRNGTPYDTPRATFFGNPDQSPSDVSVDAFAAKIEHSLAPNLTVRNTFHATHYDTLRQNVQPNSSVNNAGKVSISAYSQANQRSNYFNQSELESRLRTGSVEHLVLAGLELGHQDSDNTRLTGYFGTSTSSLVDATAPRATVNQWKAQASDTNNSTTANIAALYAQDQISLIPQWKAVLGVRYDRYSVGIDDRNAANVDLAHTDREFSPRAGLVYQPNASSSYYASYSYAFLPSGETLSLSASNADLAPEKAKNWEIGGKWDITPVLSATAAVFRLDRANVKSKDPNDSTRLQLSGLQRTEGIELGLQGQMTRDWQVYAGYANLDARVVKATGGSATSAAVPAGTTVPLVPKNAVSLWNRVDVAGGWAFGLGVVYQSSVYASTSNAVTLPAFARTDGAVYYQFDKKTRLSLNVENLLDKHYYATAGGDNNIIVGTPRNVRLTLATAF